MSFNLSRHFSDMPKKKKNAYYSMIAAALLIAAGIIITLVFTARRRDNVSRYVLDNFSHYAAQQTAFLDMCPLLREKLSGAELIQAQYNSKENSVDVYIRFPDIGNILPVRNFEFLLMHDTDKTVINTNVPEQVYKCSVPVDFTLTGYSIDWQASDYLTGALAGYVQSYNEILLSEITALGLGVAARDYLFGDPQSITQNPQLYKVRFLLSPAYVDIRVEDYGKTYLDVVSYDSSALMQYGLQELFGKYTNRFLTSAISHTDLENELSALLYDHADTLCSGVAAEGRLPANRAPVVLTRRAYKFDVVTAQSPDDVADALSDVYLQFITDNSYILDLFDNAVLTLRSQTDSLPIHTSEPEPETGLLLGVSSGVTLTIENAPGYGAYYVYFIPALQDTDIGTDGHFGIYLRDGESFTVGMPPGSYNFRYANGLGNEWYGTYYLFGPAGRYIESSTVITLDAGSFLLALNSENTLGESVDEFSVPYGHWN